MSDRNSTRRPATGPDEIKSFLDLVGPDEASPYSPGTPHHEIYPASPGTDGYSTKNHPVCIDQGMAEHNVREYSRDGRTYVVEHVAADGKRTKVSEFRNGRKVRS